MRIAIISDLHLEFRRSYIKHLDNPIVLEKLGFLPDLKCDIIIVAGDISPDRDVRELFKIVLENTYKVPVLMVYGNHDFYHGDFPDPNDNQFLWQIDNVKIAGVTLWTDISENDMKYAHLMNDDFGLIENATLDSWYAAHQSDINFLIRNEPDVIVSHHLPSKRLIAKQYENSVLNSFFASDIDLSLFENAKLWIFGHSHVAIDKTINGIHFASMPLGYPNENSNIKAKIIEI